MDSVRKNISIMRRLPFRLTLVLTIWGLVLLGIGILVFYSSPESIGPVGITGFFVLIFIAIITTLTLVKMIALRSTKVSLEGLVAVSLIPTILLALGSLRQLSLLDVFLIVMFALLINLYIKKSSKPSDSS